MLQTWTGKPNKSSLPDLGKLQVLALKRRQ